MLRIKRIWKFSSINNIRFLNGKLEPEKQGTEKKLSDEDKTQQEQKKRTNETGPKQFPGESMGPKGPEPTRYGDWEKNGRVSDF